MLLQKKVDTTMFKAAIVSTVTIDVFMVIMCLIFYNLHIFRNFIYSYNEKKFYLKLGDNEKLIRGIMNLEILQQKISIIRVVTLLEYYKYLSSLHSKKENVMDQQVQNINGQLMMVPKKITKEDYLEIEAFDNNMRKKIEKKQQEMEKTKDGRAHDKELQALIIKNNLSINMKKKLKEIQEAIEKINNLFNSNINIYNFEKVKNLIIENNQDSNGNEEQKEIQEAIEKVNNLFNLNINMKDNLKKVQTKIGEINNPNNHDEAKNLILNNSITKKKLEKLQKEMQEINDLFNYDSETKKIQNEELKKLEIMLKKNNLSIKIKIIEAQNKIQKKIQKGTQKIKDLLNHSREFDTNNDIGINIIKYDKLYNLLRYSRQSPSAPLNQEIISMVKSLPFYSINVQEIKSCLLQRIANQSSNLNNGIRSFIFQKYFYNKQSVMQKYEETSLDVIIEEIALLRQNELEIYKTFMQKMYEQNNENFIFQNVPLWHIRNYLPQGEIEIHIQELVKMFNSANGSELCNMFDNLHEIQLHLPKKLKNEEVEQEEINIVLICGEIDNLKKTAKEGRHEIFRLITQNPGTFYLSRKRASKILPNTMTSILQNLELTVMNEHPIDSMHSKTLRNILERMGKFPFICLLINTRNMSKIDLYLKEKDNRDASILLINRFHSSMNMVSTSVDNLLFGDMKKIILAFVFFLVFVKFFLLASYKEFRSLLFFSYFFINIALILEFLTDLRVKFMIIRRTLDIDQYDYSIIINALYFLSILFFVFYFFKIIYIHNTKNNYQRFIYSTGNQMLLEILEDSFNNKNRKEDLLQYI